MCLEAPLCSLLCLMLAAEFKIYMQAEGEVERGEGGVGGEGSLQ